MSRSIALVSEREYQSEEDLCADFMTHARDNGWQCYPEQGSWDILIQRRKTQIGVQAKLAANNAVLLQALPQPRGHERLAGPHYRAVLVGRALGRTTRARAQNFGEFQALAMHLRLLVLCPPPSGEQWLDTRRNRSYSGRRKYPCYYGRDCQIDWWHYRWEDERRVWTPDFEPDLPAGVPSPRSASQWAVAAVELEKLWLIKAWVCLDDARAVTTKIGGSWNASTLLQRYFQNTGKPVPGSRQNRWTLWGRPPSEQFARVMRPCD